MVETINKMHNIICHGLTEVIKTMINHTDCQEYANEILKTNDIELIKKFLEIMNFIENETDLAPPITDEIYDKLHAKYKDLSGNDVIGTIRTKMGRKTIQHSYPELRGTLSKVHFIRTSDIPKRDSRKSFEDFTSSITRACMCKHLYISSDFKFDGLSGVFEYDNGWVHAIMRGNVESNDGTDISDLFRGFDIENLFWYHIPKSLLRSGMKFGLKTEILMTSEKFEQFKSIRLEQPKNRRSAVSSILNSEDEFDQSWLNYLTIIPLQISTDAEIKLTKKEVDSGWVHVGVINNRNQYIHVPSTSSNKFTFNIDNGINSIKSRISEINDMIRYNANMIGLPIDGVVYTVTNPEVVSAMGRNNNINKFQIAYKFSAGVAKTKLVNVEFPVGPLGTVTPLAIVEPVTINGAIITKSTLSNFKKLRQMDLRIGDEVIIRYDIIPIIEKDKTCKPSNNPIIEIPENCPVCNHPLEIIGDIVRCTNTEGCPSRISGKILNYINKLNLKGIGESTINDLMSWGILKNVSDLYTLDKYRDLIISKPGYGEAKFENLMRAINSKLELYPHELLGSLGIPDVGRRIMKKITSNIDVFRLINDIDSPDLHSDMLKISGIGSNMVNKITNGIANNKELVLKLLTFIKIKSYDMTTDDSNNEVVVFSGIRDYEFERWLVSRGITVDTAYTKATTVLIVGSRDKMTSKLKKAMKDGKLILTLKEAYRKFGREAIQYWNDK